MKNYKTKRNQWIRSSVLHIPAALLLLSIQNLTAVPAEPTTVKVRQPDGSHIKIQLRGDERRSWNQTPDGFAVQKRADGAWVYSREESGRLTPSLHLVGRSNPRALNIRKPNIQRLLQTADADNRRTKGGPRPQIITSGTIKHLVIMVNYTDLSFIKSVSEMDDVFNKTGHDASGAKGSVRDFYLEVSDNSVTVESTLAGPVTVDNPFAYYGATDPGTGRDIRRRELAEDAVDKLEQSGFDFAPFDGDSDGSVDGLTILHAGGGQEVGGNDENYIWSHAWAMTTVKTYDGVSLWKYNASPELYSGTTITRIGVICHELGHHLFSLPDLYDTNGGSQGLGQFCLMSGGTWNAGGHGPAHMNVWCKQRLGWVTPTLISTDGNFSIGQIETTGNAYKLHGQFSDANE
ncbi:MAG: M6 family metalloprotease domain-containing protein, partial [Planctomycetota bacterium]|nr:M6 family metalloprotease domain-containing protein [Planctomycetota bacterium]